jgi:DNA-binding transcriptional ArsR family regulator
MQVCSDGWEAAQSWHDARALSPYNASAAAEAFPADRRSRVFYGGRMASMVSGVTLAEIAALIGDVARANILSALMDGRALTASELAWHSGVSPQTASGHLAKLSGAHLIAMAPQGRHRYYRLASPEVAQAIEALMAVASFAPKRHRPVGPRDEALRKARTCYDHLAGRLGIAIADALTAKQHVILSESAGVLTDEAPVPVHSRHRSRRRP